MSLRELTSRLSQRYDHGEARAIVRMVMESAFHMSWTDVLCGAAEGLSAEEKERLESIMTRLENGEPVQYVLGEASFCNRTFHVEAGVLIPRPETEMLVGECNLEANANDRTGILHVLDIGTGSGCIATTIALDHPAWTVEGWDISDTALRIAEGNAERLGADNVTFRKVDILSTNIDCNEKYDIIVSNPPYICEREREDMEPVVTDHEPGLALFVPDDDPLRFYKAITAFATHHLHSGGKLAFEINRAYHKEVAELLSSSGFQDVEVKKDQFDNYRIVGGRL